MGRAVSEKNKILDKAIKGEIKSPGGCTREGSLPRLMEKIKDIKSEQQLIDDGAWAMVRGRIARSPEFKDADLGTKTTVSMRQDVLFQWRVRPIKPDSKQARAYVATTAFQNRKQRRAVAREQAKEANDQFAGRMTQAPFIPEDFRKAMLKVAEKNGERIDEALPAQKNGSKP